MCRWGDLPTSQWPGSGKARRTCLLYSQDNVAHEANAKSPYLNATRVQRIKNHGYFKGKQLLCETSHDIQKGVFYLFSFVKETISSYRVTTVKKANLSEDLNPNWCVSRNLWPTFVFWWLIVNHTRQWYSTPQDNPPSHHILETIYLTSQGKSKITRLFPNVHRNRFISSTSMQFKIAGRYRTPSVLSQTGLGAGRAIYLQLMQMPPTKLR